MMKDRVLRLQVITVAKVPPIELRQQGGLGTEANGINDALGGIRKEVCCSNNETVDALVLFAVFLSYPST